MEIYSIEASIEPSIESFIEIYSPETSMKYFMEVSLLELNGL